MIVLGYSGYGLICYRFENLRFSIHVDPLPCLISIYIKVYFHLCFGVEF